MNPIHAKLKIYTYSLTGLSVISLLLRLLCYLFTFDTELHYFTTTSPLPAIADAILMLSLLWAATAFLFIPRATMRRTFPANSTATTFACSLCGFIFLFLSIRGIVAYLNGDFMAGYLSISRRDHIIHLLSLPSALLSAAYFFTALLNAARRAAWHIFLGFFPIIWAVLALAQVYFDFYHPMNEPTKVSVMLALIAVMLAFLQELRMHLGSPQPRAALVTHLLVLLLCGIGGVAGAIASPFVSPLSDYTDTFLLLSALWLYFLTRTFALLRDQLTPPIESASTNEAESETAE